MEKIKNSDVIEKITEGNSFVQISNFLISKAGDLEGASDKKNSYYKCVQRLNNSYKKLKKNKSQKGREALQTFLDGNFDFPTADDTKGDVSTSLDDLQPSKETTSDVLRDISTELKSEKLKVSFLSNKLLESTEESKKLSAEKEKYTTEGQELKREFKRTKQRETYYRQKIAKLQKEGSVQGEVESTSSEDLNETLKHLREENDELRKNITILEYEKECEVESLREAQSETIQIFDEEQQKYTPDLQLCVHHLLENHVSTSRVGPVIDACLKLAGKKANKLPSTSTVSNINVQRLILSQKQMAEIIPDKEDTTIETDETSKFGTKFGVYALRDDEGTPFVLGLRELTTKSAKDTLDTFKEILFDLDNRYYTSQNLISQNILFHIRNTMSDRAATEMKFNSLLESYREEILPEVVRDWEDLNDDDKRVIGRLNNFFCGLHSLVHIAEVADKAILQTETTNFDGNIPKHGSSFSKKTESGTTRLIRTACKAFSYQGDPKSGCHGPFMSFIKEFLTENNFQSLPLTPFKGNRFNILFHNAGVIYLFHKKMTDFLKDHGSNPWVLFDLKVDFFVAGCKALGLVCKLITTPLWNLIEKKNIHIFDMNDYYLKLTTFLEDAANNVDNFMSGNLLPFGDDTNIKRDKIYEELVCASEHDADTSTILHVVLPAIAKLTKAHFKDHLPGGIYENPDTQKRKETMSVAKHNKFSESVFAYLDSLMRHKPHIKTLSAEAYIMFAMSRTSKWLEEKDDETVRTELKEAYKNVEATRKKFKERKEEIVRRKREILQEKLRKAELDRQKKEEESLKQTNDILYWGLWQTEDQVDVVLASMNVKAKIEALKAQFRFRKNILKQKASESHLYNFSRAEESGRKNMAWTQLANNLKILIRESYSLPEGTSSEGTLNIVGKNISHRFESEGNDVWYDGHVVSQVPGFPSWFNVKYNEDEAIYTYKLKEDYERGDLKINV